MDFYLVRHGEAKPEEENPTRSLSDRGREEIRRVAQKAAAMSLKVLEIRHSGKLRAKQTAEILAEHLSSPKGPQEMKGLMPLDDPTAAQKELEESQESLMLVGHLPHLSRLASLLLVGEPEREIIQFSGGVIVCLSRAEKNWALKWIISPELTS